MKFQTITGKNMDMNLAEHPLQIKTILSVKFAINWSLIGCGEINLVIQS